MSSAAVASSERTYTQLDQPYIITIALDPSRLPGRIEHHHGTLRLLQIETDVIRRGGWAIKADYGKMQSQMRIATEGSHEYITSIAHEYHILDKMMVTKAAL